MLAIAPTGPDRPRPQPVVRLRSKVASLERIISFVDEACNDVGDGSWAAGLKRGDAAQRPSVDLPSRNNWQPSTSAAHKLDSELESFMQGLGLRPRSKLALDVLYSDAMYAVDRYSGLPSPPCFPQFLHGTCKHGRHCWFSHSSGRSHATHQ
jgi:hypothetical protein